MKLYGSITSPFVRRVRFLCLELGQPFELIDTQTEAGQALLREKNPIWKVPCAEIDGMLLWDSHTILEYLSQKYAGHPRLLRQAQGKEYWRERNLVTAADAAVESAINVFYLTRDGADVAQIAYLQKQQARVASILSWLKKELRGVYFTAEEKLGLSELAFFCNLDWMRFRAMYPVDDDPVLRQYLGFHGKHPSLAATRPPG